MKVKLTVLGSDNVAGKFERGGQILSPAYATRHVDSSLDIARVVMEAVECDPRECKRITTTTVRDGLWVVSFECVGDGCIFAVEQL